MKHSTSKTWEIIVIDPKTVTSRSVFTVVVDDASLPLWQRNILLVVDVFKGHKGRFFKHLAKLAGGSADSLNKYMRDVLTHLGEFNVLHSAGNFPELSIEEMQNLEKFIGQWFTIMARDPDMSLHQEALALQREFSTSPATMDSLERSFRKLIGREPRDNLELFNRLVLNFAGPGEVLEETGLLIPPVLKIVHKEIKNSKATPRPTKHIDYFVVGGPPVATQPIERGDEIRACAWVPIRLLEDFIATENKEGYAQEHERVLEELREYLPIYDVDDSRSEDEVSGIIDNHKEAIRLYIERESKGAA